jgi:hypothetical protein
MHWDLKKKPNIWNLALKNTELKFNVLTIVLDSLRYDSFESANTPAIDEHFDVVEAAALATFTYPAHAALFQGFYPTTNTERPFYNRFVKSVFRWFYKTKRPAIEHLDGIRSIPHTLSVRGVRTGCVGGVGWFNRASPLKNGFKSNFCYKSNVIDGTSIIMRYLDKQPFYGCFNIGTTHRPYKCPDIPEELKSVSGPKSGNDYDNSKYDEKLHQRQIICTEFVDKQLVTIFHWLKSTVDRPTFVCFCADHGECFGEDGCYGHGFYHPNVMKVPLAWSIFMPGGEHYPVTKESLKECGF